MRAGILPEAWLVFHGAAATNKLLRMMEEVRLALSNLFVFPEGTRGPDGAVGPLNAGAFKIARLCRAPVAVAAIENTHRLFTPGRFLFDTCRADTITVKLLAQFTPPYDRPDFSARALMAQARELLEPASRQATAER